MRVLVTGHHGYIGSVLVPMLLERGHDVVGLDSNLFWGSRFGDQPVIEVSSITKDIRDVTLGDLEALTPYCIWQGYPTIHWET